MAGRERTNGRREEKKTISVLVLDAESLFQRWSACEENGQYGNQSNSVSEGFGGRTSEPTTITTTRGQSHAADRRRLATLEPEFHRFRSFNFAAHLARRSFRLLWERKDMFRSTTVGVVTNIKRAARDNEEGGSKTSTMQHQEVVGKRLQPKRRFSPLFVLLLVLILLRDLACRAQRRRYLDKLTTGVQNDQEPKKQSSYRRSNSWATSPRQIVH